MRTLATQPIHLIDSNQGLPRHKIVVEGRRWFSATYGNTYHTVKVWIDDRPAITSGEVYGYGDHYLQTAAEIVKAELPELGDPSRSPLTLWARDHNIELSYTVSDGRRKDLHKGGSYRGR